MVRCYHINPNSPGRIYISLDVNSERRKLKRSGWEKIRAEEAYQLLGERSKQDILSSDKYSCRGVWYRNDAERDPSLGGDPSLPVRWIHSGETTDYLRRGEAFS